MINYKITPNFLSHEWHITLSFTQPNDYETEISLPNWVPGSYLIRDFARHITHISARCDDKAQPLTQTSKNHWQTPALSGAWEITTPSTHSTCLYAAHSSVPSAAFSMARASS